MGLVVLADRDERFIEGMRQVLGTEGGLTVDVAPTAASALESATSLGASVVVLGPSITIDSALDVSRQLSAKTPPVSAVLVAKHVTTELLHMALRAGLRDVLSATEQTYGEVARSVREADEAAAERRATDPQAACAEDRPVARVITVFSTKGGVGKSVLATNLAVALSRYDGRKVVVMDLDLEAGDVGIMLNVQPGHTILEAAQAVDKLDVDMLKSLFVRHESGLDALLAPVRPEDAEMVTAARVGRIIDLVRQVADYVVIDTPGALNELVLTAVDKSDVLLAVATLDVPSVKSMRVALQKLAQLGYRNGLIKLTVNRADSKVLLEVNDVEQALGSSVTARIPSDRLVPLSVNKGIPIVTDEPRSPVARSIVELAHVIV